MKKRPYKPHAARSSVDIDLRFLAVDLVKLEKAPQMAYVLRLLAVLNDLDSGAYLHALLLEYEKSLRNLVRKRWHDGVSLYLLRSHVGILIVALREILRSMQSNVEPLRNSTITDQWSDPREIDI